MIPYLILAALVFGACYLVDKGFAKLSRGKKAHRSGLAVKQNKRNILFGLVLVLLGIAGVLTLVGNSWGFALLSVVVLLMGAALVVSYLSFGIYYDNLCLRQSGSGLPLRRHPGAEALCDSGRFCACGAAYGRWQCSQRPEYHGGRVSFPGSCLCPVV